MQRTTLETKYQILLSQFEQLKEDFTYNLKLLEGRDAELESYVTSLQQYKEALRDRDVAISDLRVHESQLAERVTRAEGVVSMQRSAQEDILRQLSEQAETQARQIKAQAAKQIEDSTLQWQSEREALEDRIHVMQQEHDMVLNDLRAHADHTAGQLHIANGKIVALSNQIKRLESRVSELQELLKEKERKLKERTWELEDSKQSAAATEFHLSGEREQIQEQWEHLQTEYQAKVSELHIKLDTAQKSLDLLRSEQEIENQKREEHAAEQHKSFQEQSQKQLETFKSQLAGLQTEWREERDNLKQLKWEAEHLAEQLSTALQEEISKRAAATSQAELKISSLSNKLLEKDQEIGNLHKRLDAQSIKVDTTQKLNDSLKLDIEKLKQQLLDSTNKESQLRKQLLQQQLEFEKQLEEFAKSAPGDNQTDTQLILSLHRQRDCALASLKQQEEEITRLQLELEREHQELQQTRNSTSSQLQAQAQHHAEEIKILQQDVSRLKATRDDIDVLQKQLKESSDCIAQLEAERQQHISQLRDLESKNERLVLAMKEMRLELERINTTPHQGEEPEPYVSLSPQLYEKSPSASPHKQNAADNSASVLNDIQQQLHSLKEIISSNPPQLPHPENPADNGDLQYQQQQREFEIPKKTPTTHNLRLRKNSTPSLINKNNNSPTNNTLNTSNLVVTGRQLFPNPRLNSQHKKSPTKPVVPPTTNATAPLPTQTKQTEMTAPTEDGERERLKQLRRQLVSKIKQQQTTNKNPSSLGGHS